MSEPETKDKWIKIGEVRRRTGWSRGYITKLRLSGLLPTWQASRGGQWWFDAQQVERLRPQTTAK